MTVLMKRVAEDRLEADLGYRFNYLSEFVGFGPADVAVIHAAAAHLAPLVPALVDAVYVKLFGYDATKRHFLPRQHAYEGELPADLEALGLDHDLIKFRKNHLARYLVRLVTGSYDDKMVAYLDFVGKIHTPGAGNRALHIPLVQMNALMGFVADALLATILGLGLDEETKVRTARAFNKLLWLQNDLIVRHYAAGREQRAPCACHADALAAAR
jgi:Protoglobin